MIKVDCLILGKPWTIRLLKKAKYKQKNGADSLALTTCHKRRIDLSPYGRDLETITHELVHAYFWELGVGTAELDADAIEEIFCEMMAKYGKTILAQAEELHQKISCSDRPNQGAL